LRIERGRADGTFDAPVELFAADEVLSPTVADFTGDGHMDIATVQETAGTVSLVEGRQDFAFGAPIITQLDVHPIDEASGDFDNDGRPDLIVTSWDDKMVVSLRSDGAGRFTEVWRTPTTSPAYIVKATDFDGDGNVDFVVHERGGSTSAWFGDGHGRFSDHAVLSGAPAITYSMAVADVDGDGHPDVLSGGSDLAVMRYTGVRSFRAATRYPPAACITAGKGVQWLATADIDRDGDIDVLGSLRDPLIPVWLGSGDGTFVSYQCLDPGFRYKSTADVLFSSRNNQILVAARTSTAGLILAGSIVCGDYASLPTLSGWAPMALGVAIALVALLRLMIESR
jgi:hypothetical protein